MREFMYESVAVIIGAAIVLVCLMFVCVGFVLAWGVFGG